MADRVSATFGGLPVWLLGAYLLELGGVLVDGATAQGAGWTARLESQRRAVGSLSVSEVIATIDGPNAGELLEALRRKARRGGG